MKSVLKLFIAVCMVVVIISGCSSEGANEGMASSSAPVPTEQSETIEEKTTVKKKKNKKKKKAKKKQNSTENIDNSSEVDNTKYLYTEISLVRGGNIIDETIKKFSGEDMPSTSIFLDDVYICDVGPREQILFRGNISVGKHRVSMVEEEDGEIFTDYCDIKVKENKLYKLMGVCEIHLQCTWDVDQNVLTEENYMYHPEEETTVYDLGTWKKKLKK